MALWQDMRRWTWCFALVTILGAVMALGGCAVKPSGPELLRLLDVAPREVDLGDRIEVLGTNLPASEAREARVTFRGTLRRPGQAPLIDQTIVVERARVAGDKVSMVLTEALETRFCGRGDNAIHTTFEGDVTVMIPSTIGSPVHGTVKNVVLDVRAPTPRRAVLAARVAEGERALTFLGLGVSDDAPTAGGLMVASVRADSPAAAAEIAPGDLIVSFEGAKVVTVADLTPSGETTEPLIGVKRGRASPIVRPIGIRGFHPSTPADLLATGLILGVAAAVILLFMAPTAGIITWVERRVSARMQSRIGPNRAGPQGFLVWIADGIKSLLKEDIIPRDADPALFRLAPYLVFVGVSATFVVMPFGQSLIAADLDIGVLYLLAATSLVTIGILTGGWASNNKWSLLGGIRSAAQIISYEIPAAMAIACLVLMTGSLRLQDIILAQAGTGAAFYAIGGWPWHWYVFKNPVTFGLFFLYFTTALAEGNRAPFDLPEAESELVAGYSTEYSGMRYLFFFFAEWANVFVMCGIASALFLGGWQLPGVSPAQQEAYFPLQLLGAFVFLLKSWVLVFVVIWIRWTLPRVRIDQMMSLCWKWFVPLSFAAMLLTAGWMVVSLPKTVELLIAAGTFTTWLVIAAHFFRRVRFNLKQARVPLHLNPFL
jgi:NADH-quinone oxidoreductase subunit H